MLLLRGATALRDHRLHVPAVSIHAPLARSNGRRSKSYRRILGFNTCSSCEEQHKMIASQEPRYEFQYMLLLRGATPMFLQPRRCMPFQYMLLLRGATPADTHPSADHCSFNTCSSCEEQHFSLDKFPADFLFQYMLLLRGATYVRLGNTYFIGFNTCSSCEEQPKERSSLKTRTVFQYMLLLRGATCDSPAMPRRRTAVSIHAPLARSNSLLLIFRNGNLSFQYMLLLRGATAGKRPKFRRQRVSIHAPLARSNYKRHVCNFLN